VRSLYCCSKYIAANDIEHSCLHAKCLTVLWDFNQIWRWSIFVNPQYQISHKNLSSGCHADTWGQTVRNDTANSRFFIFMLTPPINGLVTVDRGGRGGYIEFYTLNLKRHSRNYRTTRRVFRRQENGSIKRGLWLQLRSGFEIYVTSINCQEVLWKQSTQSTNVTLK
jgi:hypothetical protein